MATRKKSPYATSHRLRSVFQAPERAICKVTDQAPCDDAALDVLRTANPEATVLVFVGHNPTAAYLAHMLSDGSPDPDAFRAMSEGFPAAALAVLEVAVDWADLAEGSGSVTHFHVGKG